MPLDVLLDHTKGCAARGGHAITSAPEHGLPVPVAQCGELLAHQSARDRLEVVGQHAGRALRVKAKQQMDVVRLAVHLDELGIPVFAKPAHDYLQALQALERRAGVKHLRRRLLTKPLRPLKRAAAGEEFVDTANSY